jgi:hypothetical protein
MSSFVESRRDERVFAQRQTGPRPNRYNPLMGARILASVMVTAFLAATALAKTPKNSFIFRIPPPARPESVQVRYLLTGKSGGYSGWSATTTADSVWIHTARREWAAAGLKAILFAPSCEPERVVVDDLRASSREHAFQCRPAPPLTLRGRFDRPAEWQVLRVQVQVEYVAPWANQFLGIDDGSAITVPAAEASADAIGQFTVALPSIGKDGSAPDGAFTFVLREATSGNVLGVLHPPQSLASRHGLKAERQYEDEIEFTLQRSR